MVPVGIYLYIFIFGEKVAYVTQTHHFSPFHSHSLFYYFLDILYSTLYYLVPFNTYICILRSFLQILYRFTTVGYSICFIALFSLSLSIDLLKGVRMYHQGLTMCYRLSISVFISPSRSFILSFKCNIILSLSSMVCITSSSDHVFRSSVLYYNSIVQSYLGFRNEL